MVLETRVPTIDASVLELDLYMAVRFFENMASPILMRVFVELGGVDTRDDVSERLLVAPAHPFVPPSATRTVPFEYQDGVTDLVLVHECVELPGICGQVCAADMIRKGCSIASSTASRAIW